MPQYLAYQFGPEQLTKERLARIIDDYFDLELRKNKNLKNSKDWFKIAERCKKHYKEVGIPLPKTLLEIAAYHVCPYNYVKNHPLLEIRFWYCKDKSIKDKNIGPYVPKNFNGLNIHTKHSGSEGLVDLIKFKPEMDAYLSIIGIEYRDRSNILLGGEK